MTAIDRRAMCLGLLACAPAGHSAHAAATPISEETYLPAGGLDHWITIHGDDARNPVLLVVHGGPGDVIWPFRDRLLAWEKDFTVVQWDQRGAGRTFAREGQQAAPVSLELIARDGVALATRLCHRLGKRRVLLLGHSWGSIVATRMVQLQPDRFGAYVGTGQVASWAAAVHGQYDYLLARARAAGDEAKIEELEAIGRPDPKDLRQYFSFTRSLRSQLPEPDRVWLRDLRARVAATPGLGETGLAELSRAMNHAVQNLIADSVATDLTVSARSFELPYVLIQGADDITTPTPAALAYFEQVRAPSKALAVIEGAGHFAFLTHPDEFLAQLKATAVPAARRRLT